MCPYDCGLVEGGGSLLRLACESPLVVDGCSAVWGVRAWLEYRTGSPHTVGSLAWRSAMKAVATWSVSLLG